MAPKSVVHNVRPAGHIPPPAGWPGGPPCQEGKVTILGFALQKMENARRNQSWILFRLSDLSIQDETEVLPTARRLRTLFSFRYFPVTYVYLQQTRTSIHSVTCISDVGAFDCHFLLF